ncbi:hypothetical protein GYB61_10900 [bacterium]|nr:hypothetical protein [bacterium]
MEPKETSGEPDCDAACELDAVAAMNRVYFRTRSGKYHYGIRFDDLEQAVIVALRYRTTAPDILVTNWKDYSEFEVVEGKVVFSCRKIEHRIRVLEATDLPVTATDYIELIAVQSYTKSLSEGKEIECELLAAAARDDFNLFDFGWERRDWGGD